MTKAQTFSASISALLVVLGGFFWLMARPQDAVVAILMAIWVKPTL